MSPVKGWGALGGEGWGGGRSWNLNTKAPKSCLTTLFFFSFFVIIRIPAKPNPSNTHRLAGADAINFLCFRSSLLFKTETGLNPVNEGFYIGKEERERITVERSTKKTSAVARKPKIVQDIRLGIFCHHFLSY